jgi:hypothetical protein
MPLNALYSKSIGTTVSDLLHNDLAETAVVCTAYEVLNRTGVQLCFSNHSLIVGIEANCGGSCSAVAFSKNFNVVVRFEPSRQ